jgi:phage/plasmid-like protein (TIGR03299 family)
MNPEKFYGYGGQDPLTAEATIAAAGLNWRVDLRPACVVEDGLVYPSEDILHIVRKTDRKILGTCSDRYSIIQNDEAFNFLDAVAGEGQNLRYVTAGAIDGGKRIWLLAQLLGAEFELETVRGDKTKMFLMLTTGHDGINSLKCKFTSVRIVCQNTLNLALSTGEDGVNIKHIGDPMKKVQQAREILGLAVNEAAMYDRASKWLATMPVDRDYVNAFLEEIAPAAGKSKRGATRAENVQAEILHLYYQGKGTHLAGVQGTRWGLLNAVTEYNTHERNYRDTKQSGATTNKFDALFSGGVGEKMNRKALDFLLTDAPEEVYKAPKRVTKSVDLE